MDIPTLNTTNLPQTLTSPTFIWCFLMPSIHLFSLISNILCIIIFCSNIFIKKPIAIYFISLLISDSITLLIGYFEMIHRESSMFDQSSWMCTFNKKIIQAIYEFIYTFMGRFCLEWVLYKVLWTRASTIILAVLSVQRTRTFFSLSYRETRLWAISACIVSVFIAMAITCLEWIGVQGGKARDVSIYEEIFQVIAEKDSSRELYSTYLYQNSNESIVKYPCMVKSLNLTFIFEETEQFICSSSKLANEFYVLTTTLVNNREPANAERAMNILQSLVPIDYNSSNNFSLLSETLHTTQSSDFFLKIFEDRTCQITLSYTLLLKAFDFLHSVSFTFNRHIIAIFLTNALPSFIVVLANLLSLKVIYCSKSMKYLRQSEQGNHRKRRLQNDLRAFLVIIVESFSIILISWGIPIFLTMYHCHALYVIVISTCPQIKNYFALFLYVDLFNSATNCLLYSLSGKLFRNKLFGILKATLTCGRGTLWHIKDRSLLSAHHPLDRQPSYNPSTNTNYNFGGQTSRSGSCRYSQRVSSPAVARSNTILKNTRQIPPIPPYKRIVLPRRNPSDDGSLSVRGVSDDYNGSEIESDVIRRMKESPARKGSQSIRSFLLDKVRTFGSASSGSSKAVSANRLSTVSNSDKAKKKASRKHCKSTMSRRQTTTDLSVSSSSFSGSFSHSSQQKQSLTTRYSGIRLIMANNAENSLLTRDDVRENLTSL